MGKVNGNYVKSQFLKDSCDGSGLNTSENSKDSHPLGLGVFWSDIVQLSYISVPWYGMPAVALCLTSILTFKGMVSCNITYW